MQSRISQVLFLDRDGIINVDNHFVFRVEDVVFVEGIFQLCRYFRNVGFEIVVITNQSGVGRGLFSEQELNLVMTYIFERFKEEGIEILDYFYCPHCPTDLCKCRKPLPGLFIQAMGKFGVLAENCISIGDRDIDVLAAMSAGIPQNYLLLNNQFGATHMSGPILVYSLIEIVEIHQSFPSKAQN
jgi:D-glycero-D-manno-heptose 1,7-bisphosphate phosphatase